MVCRYCGSDFEPKKCGRKNTGFCTANCHSKWNYWNLPKQYTKRCDYCGNSFETNQKNQRYCSAECGHAASKTGRTVYTKRCLYCGIEFQTIHKDHKYCTSTCASRHAGDLRRGQYFCEYCGKPRHSDHPNRNRFCSRECVNKAKHLKALICREQKQRQRELDLSHECVSCGRGFLAKHSGQRYCCVDCQYKDALRREHEQKVERFSPLIRTCPYCSKPFATTFDKQTKLYCSDECAKRAAHEAYNTRRKEQMQRAYVEPVGLKTTYHVYQGHCAICGLPVPAISDPASVWGPTVDHIIPLSKGGLHKKSNCQLAHRLCNSMKLDTTNDFKIDWPEKLKMEPGRWNKQLDELWNQLGQEEKSVV